MRLLPVGATPTSWPVETGRVAPSFLPMSVGGLAKETEAIPAALAAAREMRQLGDRPLIVLTAGQEQPQAALLAMGVTREQGLRIRDASRVLHDDQASWSRHGRHELVPDASHYIQFDRPDVMIHATRVVVEAVRATGAGL